MSFSPGKVTAMTWDELVASNAALSGEVRRSHEALKIAQLTIDKSKSPTSTVLDDQ